jgi:ABC-type multidrug transport system fused ATPase/permease subunit
LEFRKLLRLFDFTKGHRRHYVFMFTFLVLQMATYQLLFYSLKYLINDLIPKKEVAPLLWYVACWTGIFVIHSAFTLLAARNRIIIVRSMVAGLRSEIIRKLQILAIRYFDVSGTGAMSARLLMDVDKTQLFFDWLTLDFFTAVITGVSVVPWLFSIDPMLTLITVLYVPTIPTVQRIFRGRLMKNSNFLRNTNARLSEKLIDFISGIRHIRLFATEEEQSEKILNEVEAVKHVDIRYSMTMRIFMMVIQFIGELMPIVLWVVAGILMIHNDKLTLGSVVAYLALVRQLLSAVYGLFQGFDQVVAASPSIRAISEILDSEEVENQLPTVATFVIDGSVEFRHVDFSYQNRPGQLQLHDISVSIKQGEKIALVGESGSGKTTFINALLGRSEERRVGKEC